MKPLKQLLQVKIPIWLYFLLALVYMLTVYFSPTINSVLTHKIENRQSGERLGKYEQFSASYESLLHTTDVVDMSGGKTSFVTGSKNGTIKLWSSDGILERTFSYHFAAITSLLQLGDQLIVSADENGYVYLVDIPRNSLQTIIECNSPVRSLTSYRENIYGITRNGDLFIWNNITQKLDKHLIFEESRKKEIVAICASKFYLFCASSDSNIYVFERESFTEVEQLRRHEDQLKTISVYNEEILVSIDRENELIIWDLNTLKYKTQLSVDHSVGENELIVHSGFIYLASQHSKLVLVYKLGNDNQYLVANRPWLVFHGSFFHESIYVLDKYLYAGSTKGNLEVWNIDEKILDEIRMKKNKLSDRAVDSIILDGKTSLILKQNHT